MPKIIIEFTDNDDQFYNENGKDDNEVRDFTHKLLERLMTKIDDGATSMSGPVMSINGNTLGRYHVTML